MRRLRWSGRAVVLLALGIGCGGESGRPAQDAGFDAGVVVRDAGFDAGLMPPDAGSDAAIAELDAATDSQGPSLGIDAGTGLEPNLLKVRSCLLAPDMSLCDSATDPDRWYDVCVQGACQSPGCAEHTCNTTGPYFRLPPSREHTGLVKTDTAEPITTDRVTGLQWVSCGLGLRGSACDQGTAFWPTFDEALAHCDALVWGGRSDWYLPDAHELFSLNDQAQQGFSAAAFPNQEATGSAYLSTSMRVNRRQCVRGSGVGTCSGSHSALCVRRGTAGPGALREERFVFHEPQADGQRWFEDRTTGLDFQGCVSDAEGVACDVNRTVLQQDAAPHCDALVWAGFDDWRLPTYKEAHSLFSYRGDTFDVGVPSLLFNRLHSYILVADLGPLFDCDDATPVGIGVSTATYPVVCVRDHD